MNAPRTVFSRLLTLSVATLCAAAFAPTLAFGVKVADAPQTVVQPNGAPLNLYVSGDEFFSYLHTKNGSLVMENSEGNYVYASERFDDVLVPGTVRVDSNAFYEGLTVDDVDIEANSYAKDMLDDLIANTQPRYTTSGQPLAASATTETIATTPVGDTALTKSDLTNVVCYIRFADELEYAASEAATDSALLNSSALSLKNFIKAQSEGACSMTSVFPKGDSASVTSYQSSQPRGYFEPYNETTNPLGYKDDDELGVREQALIQEATAWLNQKSDLPSSDALDRNNDGVVDSIMFIMSGDAGAWNSLLWPHMWGLSTDEALLNGKQVQKYSVVIQNYERALKLSAYCHETMHVLGFPDLYRYYATGEPVARWDVMASTLPVPQYATAYMRKTIADWGPAIQKAQIGENTVRAPYASGDEPLSVAIPINDNESLVFEYRRGKEGTFDHMLPSSGLLPYRVRTTPEANTHGNAQSPSVYPDGYYIFRTGVTARGTLPWYQSAGNGLGDSLGGGTSDTLWALSSSNNQPLYGEPGKAADSFFDSDGNQLEYYVGDVSVNTSDTISFKLNTINDFNYYDVSFDARGGNVTPQTQSVFAGQLSTEPTVTPTRSGYTFGGWYKDEACMEQWSFTTDKVLVNTTLYAKWTEKVATVTFDTRGGSKIEPVTVACGELISQPTTPTRSGYAFGGWYKDAAFTEPWAFEIDKAQGSVTLYAKWLANAHTVTFDSRGGSAVASIATAYDAILTKPASPTRTGYLFNGWYMDAACTLPWHFEVDTVSGDMTLYAKWLMRTFRVTFDSRGGSAVSSKIVSYGSLVTKPSSPKRSGYAFAGWYKDSACTHAWSFSTTKVYSGVTLYAKWKSTSNYITYMYKSTGTWYRSWSKSRLSNALTIGRTKSSVRLKPKISSKARVYFKYAGHSWSNITGSSKTIKLKRGQQKTVYFKVRSESGAYRTYKVVVKRKR